MEKWSLLYEIIKFYFRTPAVRFFRKFVVEGLDNIPKDKPIIFAPNHQNAIMDPLAIIYSTNKQPVFLARGDAFNNKIIAKIFATFKILPVFRQRDGIAQLKKNEEVFQKSVDVLKNNNAFCLFPEGQHNPQRFLRPLQKAIPRIAFQAEEQTDYKLDIKIIPTGIYYENKEKALSVLHIHYGKAIDVLDFVEEYKENQQKAMNSLKIKMTEGLKPLMIDIQDKENYEVYEDILSICTPQYISEHKLKHNQKNKFNTDKLLIDKISDKSEKNENYLQNIKKEIEDFKLSTKQYNIPIDKLINIDNCIVKTSLKAFLLLLLPIFIVGWVINILPHQVPSLIAKKFLKDPQYIGSIKFGVGGVIFPIYYLILFSISFAFVDCKYAFLILVILPLLGLFNVYYKNYLKNLFISIKIILLKKELKREIKQRIESIYKSI